MTSEPTTNAPRLVTQPSDRKPWLAAVLPLVFGYYGLLYSSTIASFIAFLLYLALTFVLRDLLTVYSLLSRIVFAFLGYYLVSRRVELFKGTVLDKVEAYSWQKAVLSAALIFAVSYFFVTSVATVSRYNGSSMLPTIRNGEAFSVLILPALRGEMRRDTIVRIANIGGKGFLIRRVVALEGDTVEMKKGLVYVNGNAADDVRRIGKLRAARCIDESSAISNLASLGFDNRKEAQKVTVPKGQVFLLADNRADNFEDSRIFGPLPLSKITGVVHPSSSSAAASLKHEDCIPPQP
ncbi:signal peptidase I [Deinococcus sp.]|uniref:signal peptidase I n=1 Tax=Deinococcus sp. TaxID=47478 RepID=UPI003CC6C260